MYLLSARRRCPDQRKTPHRRGGAVRVPLPRQHILHHTGVGLRLRGPQGLYRPEARAVRQSLGRQIAYRIQRHVSKSKSSPDFNAALISGQWMPASNNRSEFVCQHGPRECSGNRAQACALWEIQQSSAAQQQPPQSQPEAFDLVNCAMSSSDPSTAVPQVGFTCLSPALAAIQIVGHSPSPSIRSCSDSAFGDELLVANGQRTKAIESPLKFVPTILVNGVSTPRVHLVPSIHLYDGFFIALYLSARSLKENQLTNRQTD
jgi:hypothetical protein